MVSKEALTEQLKNLSMNSKKYELLYAFNDLADFG